MARRRGFFFGDIHFPFHHKNLLSLAMYFCIKGNYDYVCQVGDLRDWYSASKFPRSYNVFTPKHEQQWASYYAELFWGILREKLPHASLFQILGNHCVRPHKRIVEKAPEFEQDIVSMIRDLYTFEGVKTVYDSREELYIDDICIIHGYLSRLGAHAAYNLKSVVCGHSHTGGVAYIRNAGHEGGILWELNAGYLADPFTAGLSYTAQKRATKWTWGFGAVDEWGPRFVPLHPEDMNRFKGDPLLEELIKALG